MVKLYHKFGYYKSYGEWYYQIGIYAAMDKWYYRKAPNYKGYGKIMLRG